MNYSRCVIVVPSICFSGSYLITTTNSMLNEISVGRNPETTLIYIMQISRLNVAIYKIEIILKFTRLIIKRTKHSDIPLLINISIIESGGEHNRIPCIGKNRSIRIYFNCISNPILNVIQNCIL